MSGIPTTGTVTMTDLKTNFSAGAAAGNSLSGYRSKTIYDSSTNAATTIGATGAISFSTFRGKRSLAPPGAITTAPVITLMTTSGATVTWSVSASATSYYLYIGTAVGGSQLYAADTGSATTTATITATFVVNTSYFPSVYGKSGALTGTPNQNATGYIVCAPPTNVALTVSSVTSWTITWTAASYATGYSWALSTSSTNATSLSSGTVTGNTTVTSDAQTSLLSSSTQYYAFVYATRTESKSAYGSGTYTTPAPPTVTAAVPTVTGNTITYTWTVSGASSFTVTLYKTTSTAASGGSSVATATAGTSSTFTMTSSGFYYITITAQNSIAVTATATSASALSATFTAPPVATAATPTASVLPYTQLANGAAFPAAGTSFSLLNTDTGAYAKWWFLMIRYFIDGNPYYFTTPPNTAGEDISSFDITSLGTYNNFSMPAGNITRLQIRVTSINYFQTDIIYTNTSGLISMIDSYNSFAGAPSATAPTVLSVRTGGAVMTYTWGTSSGTATGYTVNLYASGTALATLTNTTATSATYTPVSGTTYYTTVTATNGGGTSATATSPNFTYVLPVPTAPTGVTVAVDHGTSVITVSWNSVSGATSYTLSDGVTPTTVSGTSGTLTLLTTGAKQVITVFGVNTSGNGAITTACSFIYFGSRTAPYTLTTAPAQAVNVIMAGGAGGSSFTNSGGKGGLLTGTANLAGTWYISAGTLGASTTTTAGGAGGVQYGGAGATYSSGKGGGGGGGATIISTNDTFTANYHTAAGGGGAGKTDGGDAGGTGLDGSFGVAGATSSPNTGGAGGGATGATTFYQGGTGTVTGSATAGGGGGGGGYHAGAGGNGGGGGGGQNYNQNLSGSVVSLNAAGAAGYLFLYWNTPAPTFT